MTSKLDLAFEKKCDDFLDALVKLEDEKFSDSGREIGNPTDLWDIFESPDSDLKEEFKRQAIDIPQKTTHDMAPYLDFGIRDLESTA